MRDLDQMPDAEFAKLWRAWLEQNYPQEWRRSATLRLRGASEKRWLRLLHDHGWRAPAWPTDVGGLGLSLRKQLIYKAELERFGAARYLDSGGVLLGPILIRYGTAAQKQKYLPAILNGDDIWCQGYSEPNAGSDLASLQLKAVAEGDSFVLNGSKIWTTQANDAARIFVLARTSSDGRKQEGISFFLCDMQTPGITVRPIVNLTGEDEFSQVFFDYVRVPAANLVHQLNKGWDVAKSLLGAERVSLGSPHLAKQAFAILDRTALDMGAERGPSHLERRARLMCDLHDLEALYRDVCDALTRGEAPASIVSSLKILASELFQRITEALLAVGAEHAGAASDLASASGFDVVRQLYLIGRPMSIYGGTNEVQRDIIARHLLG